LDVIFAPRSVAVVGATEKPGSVGRAVLANLSAGGFGGTIFPVNPYHQRVLGLKSYPKISDIPGKVDLAVIVTPAATVPELIRQCVDAGVGGAIIISAGFKELGATGAELERQILEHARRGGLRLIGPNCLGLMNPVSNLNATFANGMAKAGNVAFLSQSGALCTAILDWSFRELVGFSAFVSVGSMLDVGWGDLIDYLGDDPHTKSILIYMESIGDARAFLSAAREVALSKPIIVIKAGRTEAAAKAAASHTGSLTGSDDVLEAAFRRVGVLRVSGISDLFYMAETLAKQPRPRGPRLTILTNAGGPGVLATDALIGNGGKLAILSQETTDELNRILPPHWSRNNPIDILGDASPDRYAKTLEIAAKDPNSDGLLVILTPQDMTDPKGTAEALQPFAKLPDKVLLASWMGGPAIAAGEQILIRAGIPTFPYPDTAARAFHYMWQYTYNLRGLYETPALPHYTSECDRETAAAILSGALRSSRTLLDEVESKRLLLAYGIPTVRTEVAKNAEAAVRLANEIGYPVVLKILSPTITHKTDVGGVKLNLTSESAVRNAFDAIAASVSASAGVGHCLGVTVQPMVNICDAYEIILGSSIDPQFGPVLLFGVGGQLVEIFKDSSLGLPPLNATLARRMMEQTKIFHAFKGVRGRRPVDLNALGDLLVRFSLLVIDQPRISQIDINPLLVSSEKIIALDARIVLFPSDVPPEKLPRPALRRYPAQYVSTWTMKDGTPAVIRPIRPEDEPLMVEFHRTLSERTIHMRYFHAIKLTRRVSHERLLRICSTDFDREIVLVAEHRGPATGKSQITGIGRLSKIPGGSDAEFAILISDTWQNRGIGTELLRRLIEVGREEGVERICADILNGNCEMLRICEKLGFVIGDQIRDAVVRAELHLTLPSAAARPTGPDRAVRAE
jgi:acetyltransferase